MNKTSKEIETMANESFDAIINTSIPEHYARHVGHLDALQSVMERIEICEQTFPNDPKFIISYLKDFISWDAGFHYGYVKEAMNNGS